MPKELILPKVVGVEDVVRLYLNADNLAEYKEVYDFLQKKDVSVFKYSSRELLLAICSTLNYDNASEERVKLQWKRFFLYVLICENKESALFQTAQQCLRWALVCDTQKTMLQDLAPEFGALLFCGKSYPLAQAIRQEVLTDFYKEQDLYAAFTAARAIFPREQSFLAQLSEAFDIAGIREGLIANSKLWELLEGETGRDETAALQLLAKVWQYRKFYTEVQDKFFTLALVRAGLQHDDVKSAVQYASKLYVKKTLFNKATPTLFSEACGILQQYASTLHGASICLQITDAEMSGLPTEILCILSSASSVVAPSAPPLTPDVTALSAAKLSPLPPPPAPDIAGFSVAQPVGEGALNIPLPPPPAADVTVLSVAEPRHELPQFSLDCLPEYASKRVVRYLCGGDSVDYSEFKVSVRELSPAKLMDCFFINNDLRTLVVVLECLANSERASPLYAMAKQIWCWFEYSWEKLFSEFGKLSAWTTNEISYVDLRQHHWKNLLREPHKVQFCEAAGYYFGLLLLNGDDDLQKEIISRGIYKWLNFGWALPEGLHIPQEEYDRDHHLHYYDVSGFERRKEFSKLPGAVIAAMDKDENFRKEILDNKSFWQEFRDYEVVKRASLRYERHLDIVKSTGLVVSESDQSGQNITFAWVAQHPWCYQCLNWQSQLRYLEEIATPEHLAYGMQYSVAGYIRKIADCYASTKYSDDPAVKGRKDAAVTKFYEREKTADWEAMLIKRLQAFLMNKPDSITISRLSLWYCLEIIFMWQQDETLFRAARQKLLPGMVRQMADLLKKSSAEERREFIAFFCERLSKATAVDLTAQGVELGIIVHGLSIDFFSGLNDATKFLLLQNIRNLSELDEAMARNIANLLGKNPSAVGVNFLQYNPRVVGQVLKCLPDDHKIWRNLITMFDFPQAYTGQVMIDILVQGSLLEKVQRCFIKNNMLDLTPSQELFLLSLVVRGNLCGESLWNELTKPAVLCKLDKQYSITIDSLADGNPAFRDIIEEYRQVVNALSNPRSPSYVPGDVNTQQSAALSERSEGPVPPPNSSEGDDVKVGVAPRLEDAEASAVSTDATTVMKTLVVTGPVVRSDASSQTDNVESLERESSGEFDTRKSPGFFSVGSGLLLSSANVSNVNTAGEIMKLVGGILQTAASLPPEKSFNVLLGEFLQTVATLTPQKGYEALNTLLEKLQGCANTAVEDHGASADSVDSSRSVP